MSGLLAAGAAFLFLKVGTELAGRLADGREHQRQNVLTRHGGRVHVFQYPVEPLERIKLYPRREVFTSSPIPCGTTVCIDVRGVYCHDFGLVTGYRGVDCRYFADDAGNFLERFDPGFMIDGEYATPVHEDRAEHQYCYSFTGSGRRLSLLLLPPKPGTPAREQFLCVAILSAQKEDDVSQKEHEKQLRIQQRREARLHSLRAQYEPFKHYGDAAWLHSFAAKHQEDLIRRRDEIVEEWTKFHRDNEAELAYIRDQDAALYEMIMWETRVLALAEKFSVTANESADAILLRIKQLQLRYRHFAHYADEVWIAEYVRDRKHQQHLFAKREAILAADQAFHADTAFIEALQAADMSTYLRTTWEVRALAAAEKLPKETPEEYRARHRQLWVQKAHHAKSKLVQREQFRQQFCDELIAEGMDEDEAEQLTQDLDTELWDDDQEGRNGPYRQL